MTTSESDWNVLTPLSRALLSALAPGAGTRSSGSVLATASGATAVVVPPNSYLVPVIEGSDPITPAKQLDETRLFKTALNPATELPFQQGGAWTVPGSGSLPITIRSALGGARHNLAEDATLRWDPAIPGLAPTVTVRTGGIAGGVDPASGAGIRSAAFFASFGPNAFQDLFAAGLGVFPALVLTWLGSDPVEPAIAGLRQGSTRAARQKRMFRETFAAYLVGSNMRSSAARQGENIYLAELVAGLWGDRGRNDDGEYLSAVGGINITSRRQQPRDPRYYVIEILLSTVAVKLPIDSRTWGPWNKTRIVQQTEAVAGPPPLPPLTLPDETVEME